MGKWFESMENRQPRLANTLLFLCFVILPAFGAAATAWLARLGQ